MDMKVCSKCKQKYPATFEYFRKDARYKNNLFCHCKNCEKEHRYKNKERNSDVKKEWYKNNKIRVLEKAKARYELNKEPISEYYKKWRNENCDYKKEYDKNYQKRNIKKYIANTIKRRYQKKQLPSNYTLKEWEECKAYFQNTCCYCGRNMKRLEREHFVSLIHGGEFTKHNIVPACRACNASKGIKSFDTWYSKQPFYQAEREQKILDYLGYKDGIQQLSIL